MDKNSNDLYLQGQKTYLSQPPRHVANDNPPQQKILIRTKSQMIKFCSDRFEWL